MQAESKGIPPVFIGIIISSAPCSAMFLSPVLGYLVCDTPIEIIYKQDLHCGYSVKQAHNNKATIR